MGNKTVLESIIEGVCIFGIIGGIILGLQLGYIYFSIAIISVLILIFEKIRRKKKLIRLHKEIIRGQWGKDHIENRDFLHIRRLYDLLEKKDEDSFTIDDITWRDLNMDLIFSKLDHTKSYTGMNQLYNILRQPIFDENILKERSNRINSLLEMRDVSLELQYPLSILGKKQSKEILEFFKNGLKIDKNPLVFYRILSYFSYLSLGVLLFNRQIGFTALVIMLTINAGIYQKNKYRIEAEIETFRYIGNLVRCAEEIIKLDTRGINIKQDRLADLLRKTKQIYKNVGSLNTNASPNAEIQMVMDYINMITLRETIIFYKTINLINKYKDELFEIYSSVGEIDAYISIASYRDSLDYYSEPIFTKDNTKFYLEADGLYHPLLQDPVAYYFIFDNKGALVTGSNASGKSTFLRTIGVNSLLAQSFYLVLAKEYKGNFFKLLTSIGTTDNIADGDSYFMAEAKSLKRIIDVLDNDQPVLCILDEIFRGTNTLERISGASEVLNYMANRNTLVVAATHDLELTTIVDDRYDNYHFMETIDDNDIRFDYLLRYGPTTSRNALAILKYLDYPKEIYENANKMAEKLEAKS